MKTQITLLSLFLCNIIFAQNSIFEDIPTYKVTYDPACVKKYEYVTDVGYIVEDSYTNYHLPIDAERTIILKVSNEAATVTDTKNAKTLSCANVFAADKKFVQRVNNEGAKVIIGLPSENGIVYKEVDYLMYRVMNDKEMSYFAAPFMSFIYDYDVEHNPGEVLRADDLIGDRRYVARHLQYGESTVQGIRNDIFLKMYRDACYNRQYGVTTPRSPQGKSNPLLENVSLETGKKAFRSCQHPIHAEYLKGIGLYREFYQEGNKTYTSKLTAIDDIPIDEYLKLVAPNYEFANFNDNQSFGSPLIDTETVAMRGKENAKEEIKNEEIKPTPVSNKIPGRGEVRLKKVDNSGNTEKGVSSNSKMVAPVIKYAKSKAINVKSSKTLKNYHIVAKGETLYSLSKRYNITVDALRALNHLNDNTIYTNQQLIVKAN